MPLFYAFFYVGVAFIFGRVDLKVRNELQSFQTPRKFHDYAGVINVHSSKSTGSSNIDDIHQSASDANLDFILLTDLNDFNPDKEEEVYLDNTLLMVGGEYSFIDSRLINFDFKTSEHLQGIGRNHILFSDILDKEFVLDKYGFFLLAHPNKPGYEMKPPLPKGLGGIEIYNLKSIWQLAWLKKRSSFLWALFLYPINMEWSFTRLFASYTNPELRIWEKENLSRPLIGFAGSDADSNTQLPWGNWQFPSYKTYFSILRNHILIESELTGELESDRKKIIDALKKGQFYISLDLIGNAKGFETYILSDSNQIYPLGSILPFSENTSLIIDLENKPKTEFRVIVYRNSEKILISNSQKTEIKIHEKGNYRVLVQVKLNFPFEGERWVNWIITNHFYIE